MPGVSRYDWEHSIVSATHEKTSTRANSKTGDGSAFPRAARGRIRKWTCENPRICDVRGWAIMKQINLSAHAPRRRHGSVELRMRATRAMQGRRTEAVRSANARVVSPQNCPVSPGETARARQHSGTLQFPQHRCSMLLHKYECTLIDVFAVHCAHGG